MQIIDIFKLITLCSLSLFTECKFVIKQKNLISSIMNQSDYILENCRSRFIVYNNLI